MKLRGLTIIYFVDRTRASIFYYPSHRYTYLLLSCTNKIGFLMNVKSISYSRVRMVSSSLCTQILTCAFRSLSVLEELCKLIVIITHVDSSCPSCVCVNRCEQEYSAQTYVLIICTQIYQSETKTIAVARQLVNVCTL